MIIYIFIIKALLRRKAIDFIMFHDRIYTRSSVFYATIIEKVKVVFLFRDSDDLMKSISECNIIL